jgi:hypothetical protein
MENLAERITELSISLKEFSANDHPSATLAESYNTLLRAAKDQLSEDPMVQAATLTGIKMNHCRDNAGAMRAVLQQILSAMGETGPAFEVS